MATSSKSFTPKMFKLERIEWYDHFSYREAGRAWFEPSYLAEVKGPPVMITTGYVVGEDKQVVCVAGTLRADGAHCSDIQFVLKCAIKKRNKL